MSQDINALIADLRAGLEGATPGEWMALDEYEIAALLDEIERLRAANVELQGIDATLQLALERAQRERDEARADAARLREALAPFAKAAPRETFPSDLRLGFGSTVTMASVGDLRRARAAYEEGGQ